MPNILIRSRTNKRLECIADSTSWYDKPKYSVVQAWLDTAVLDVLPQHYYVISSDDSGNALPDTFAYAEITGVAIKQTSAGAVFSLPRPNRHSDVIYMMVRTGVTKRVTMHEFEQGFVVRDIFLSRHIARIVATENEQTIRTPNTVHGLFSEDLW